MRNCYLSAKAHDPISTFANNNKLYSIPNFELVYAADRCCKSYLRKAPSSISGSNDWKLFKQLGYFTKIINIISKEKILMVFEYLVSKSTI